MLGLLVLTSLFIYRDVEEPGGVQRIDEKLTQFDYSTMKIVVVARYTMEKQWKILFLVLGGRALHKKKNVIPRFKRTADALETAKIR